MNDNKYYIANGNNKKSEESNKYLKISKLISIDDKHGIYRLKKKKPILPIIKPSLFNIFNNNLIINHNNNSSILDNNNHMKTEGPNMSNQNRLIFNGIFNDYKANLHYSNINNNELKYKLFSPYKKYNISILKGS